MLDSSIEKIVENNYRVVGMVGPVTRENYRDLFMETINKEMMFSDDKKISLTIYNTKEHNTGWKYLTPVTVRIRPKVEVK